MTQPNQPDDLIFDGFAVERVYGDYAGGDLAPASRKYIVLARPEEER